MTIGVGRTVFSVGDVVAAVDVVSGVSVHQRRGPVARHWRNGSCLVGGGRHRTYK